MASDFNADMPEVAGSRPLREELTGIVKYTGIRYPGDLAVELAAGVFDGGDEEAAASLKDQVKGFLKASAEMPGELGRGCRDVAVQSPGKEDSSVVRSLEGHERVVSCCKGRAW